MRIIKPSGPSYADRVPYASLETPLGWEVTNWLPGEQKVASLYNVLKVYEISAGEKEELQRLLTAQSELESLDVVKLADPVRSIEDRRALAVMEQTTKNWRVKTLMCQGCFGEKKTHRFLITMTWLCGDLSR